MREFLAILCLLFGTMLVLFNRYYLRGKLTNPFTLFSVYWLSLIGVGVLVINFKYNYKGIIYIVFVTLITFFISAFFYSITDISDRSRKETLKKFEVSRSRNMLFLATILGSMFAILSLKQQGIALSGIFNFSSLLDINSQMAIQRYSGSTNSASGGLQLLIIFQYFAPVIGGYHFGSTNNKKEQIYAFVGFIPVLLTMSTQNTKSGVISAVTFFIAACIIAHLYDRTFSNFKFKQIIRYVVIIVILLGVLFLSMVMRTGKFNLMTIAQIWKKFIVYAFGQVPVFDYWFSNRGIFEYGFGSNTFIGIANLLGIASRNQGIYNDAVYINQIPANIYTAFRGLIQDFGNVGSILFLVILLCIGIYSYRRLYEGFGININSFILLNVYFFIFQSFLVSSWSYTSYLATMLLFVPYLMIVRKNEKNTK